MKWMYGIVSAVLFLFGMMFLMNLLAVSQGWTTTWHMPMGGMMPFGMLVAVIVWGLVLYGLWTWVKPQFTSKSAEDILRMRLAKGEITDEEYQRLKSTLKGS